MAFTVTNSRSLLAFVLGLSIGITVTLVSQYETRNRWDLIQIPVAERGENSGKRWEKSNEAGSSDFEVIPDESVSPFTGSAVNKINNTDGTGSPETSITSTKANLEDLSDIAEYLAIDQNAELVHEEATGGE